MRINQKHLAAFRKTHTREIFRGKEQTYDIVVALFLIERDGNPVKSVSVDDLATLCGFDHRPVKEEEGELFFLRPDGSTSVINQAHALGSLDLEKPLIFAGAEFIDGMHRVYQAFMAGMETLPAYVLTRQQAQQC